MIYGVFPYFWDHNKRLRQITYRDLCFIGEKAMVDADVYIDDAPHNIESLRAAGKEVIIFDASYNREIPGPRAFSWDEAKTLILDAKARWDAQQA